MEDDNDLQERLLIPAGQADNTLVVIPLDALPEDTDEIIEVLGAELAPISVWLDVAKAYLQRGSINQYLGLLR
jgi:RNA polymerase-associated protein CTR9